MKALMVCFLGLAFSAGAQTAPLKFEKLPSDVGLNQGSASCFFQDSRGVLWIGTWSGLVSYDGYKTRLFQQEPGTSDGLQSDQITQIIEDKSGHLWLGTIYGGLHRFDRGTERFSCFRNNPNDANSLSDNDVWGLFEDSKGYIWIGTKNGLNRLDPKTNTFLRIAEPQSPIPRPQSDYIYSICETADGSIWSTTTQGLNRITFKANQEYLLHRYTLHPSGKLGTFDDFMYRVVPAKNEPNTLWLGTKAGLKKATYRDADANYFQIERAYRNIPNDPTSLSHNIVPDFCEAPDGNLWIATFHGLNCLNQKTGKFQRYFAQSGNPLSLSANFIRCLYKDRTGILWIGAENRVNKLNLNNKPFQSIHFDKAGGSENSNVTSICNASTKGSIWVSAIGGLNRIDLASGTAQQHFYHLSPGQLGDFANFINNVCLDADGWLWFSTQGAGVLRIRERDIPASGGRLAKLQQFSSSSPVQLNDNYVMCVQESPGKGMWFGFWDGGLALYDNASGKATAFDQVGPQNLKTFPNVALLQRKEGDQHKLYVGTRGNGLLKFRFEPISNSLVFEQHYHFVTGESGCLSNDRINALLNDSKGRLWVCTSKGLNLLESNGKTFRTISKNEGLPNVIIQSILETPNGQYWVSTQQGIASMTVLDNGDLKIRAYDALDGLGDNFFMNSCAAALPSGMLAFGGASSVSLFTPEAIREDTIAPLSRITDFLLFNQSVPLGTLNGRTILRHNIAETSEIVLNYQENVLAFEFASLHFAEPRKNKFAHKLEGFDRDWVYTDANMRFAHYTNLPYKSYVFYIKSSNGDGVWGEPVSVKLRIEPPFWLTWWAYCLYVLIGLGLLYAGWRVAHMRAEYRANLAVERMERGQIEAVNRAKFQFFTDISHELRTPLTLILTPLEQLIKEFKGDTKLQQLYAIMHHNAARLHTMINQLLDLRKGEEGIMQLQVAEEDFVAFIQEITLSFNSLADQRHIQLDFYSETTAQLLWFDHEQMEKVVYNLLGNALKYTPAQGKINVRVTKGPDLVYLHVTDTGPGIPSADSQRIFERFYQTGKGMAVHEERGAGIGLALVKMLVEAHGGTVTVQSKEGQGSTFSVQLPLGKLHFKENQFAAADTSRLGIHNPEIVYVNKADFVTTVESTGKEAAKVEAEKHRILVVEDNEDIAMYLLQNLSDDFLVETANNGAVALEKALASPPDLVLSDLAMPEMDGLELCKRLKTNVVTSHIPVVLLTARSSLIFKVDGLGTGADDYITKPFNLQLLTLRLHNLIQTRIKLREKFSRNIELNPSEVATNTLDEEFLRNILASIEQNLDDSNYSVDQLAHDLHMSRIQVYRKIKALTDSVPNALIRSVRLKKAAQLLATGQFNVSEVAYKVGFTDLKYFRERFKEQFGVNPGRYVG